MISDRYVQSLLNCSIEFREEFYGVYSFRVLVMEV